MLDNVENLEELNSFNEFKGFQSPVTLFQFLETSATLILYVAICIILLTPN